MHKLAQVKVGGTNPVRIMGILNTSPESFYKKSIKKENQIAESARQMEYDGADFIDVGGMSTAPYLSTMVSEREEIRRVSRAIRQIQNATNLPISIDTCRASVAKEALLLGTDILNDISGLKYDKEMIHTVSRFHPSVVLCAYGTKMLRGNLILQTKRLLQSSIAMAKSAKIKPGNIAIDPAIGFFRKTGKNSFYTKITKDWFQHDLDVLRNLHFFKKMNYPILISASNKSFIGKMIDKKDPSDRIYGSIVAEAIAVINGADIIRTHNVKETKDAVSVAQRFSKKLRKNL
ncbi:MAG TPA: dihydropteroate synthase [Candidatus Nitrosotenuis sp.]|nr:dihydropteroate synthase [Candidatus Nitrosotenuis sp.]